MSFPQNISMLLKYALISFVMVMPTAEANEAVEASPDLLTQQEIQQGLLDMKNKMNQRIEQWGSALSRHDFERVRGKMQLKAAKQLDVCAIFQGVIDETYLAAQANKHRLTEADQKLISNRTDFIQALGFKNNIVQTELGFDCRMK